MRTKIVGIVLVLFASVFVSSQLNCADCAHNQFGEPYCLARTSCKCFCQIITVNGQKSCFTLDPCVLNQCLLAPQAYTLASDKKLTNDIAAHPWITDTTAAETIRVHSNAMGAVFATVQYVIKEKHKTDISGWMSTNKENPSDASGWVRYDFIAKSNGMDEIRLTYEESLVQEELLIASAHKKWILYRLARDSDNSLHHEQIAMGNIVTK